MNHPVAHAHLEMVSAHLVPWLFSLVLSATPMVLQVVPAKAQATDAISVISTSISASEIRSLTNDMRVGVGLNSLTGNPALARSAQMKAEDMASKSYFAHENPQGQRLGYWLAVVGYDYQYAGENLAVGFETSSGTMNGWKNSPTHYANIVKPEYTEIGIGVADGVYKGEPVTFVVQHFGVQKAIVVTPAPVEVIEQPVVPAEQVETVEVPVTVPAGIPVAPVQSVPVAEPVVEKTVETPVTTDPVLDSTNNFLSDLNLITPALAAVVDSQTSSDQPMETSNNLSDLVLSVLALIWMVVAFEVYVEIESHREWLEAIAMRWKQKLV